MAYIWNSVTLPSSIRQGSIKASCKVYPEIAVQMMKMARTAAGHLEYPYPFMEATESGFASFSPSEIFQMGQFKSYFGNPKSLTSVLKNSRKRAAGNEPIIPAEYIFIYILR
jgi:hypothetical protein